MTGNPVLAFPPLPILRFGIVGELFNGIASLSRRCKILGSFETVGQARLLGVQCLFPTGIGEVI